MTLRFIGIPVTETLQGEIDGFLTFEMGYVEIGNDRIKIDTIRNIEISNEDYYGKIVASGAGNFNSCRSNGVANIIKLKLYSGELKKCNFQIYNSNDIQKIQNELISYYLNGEIELENLGNILGKKSKNEIAELKSEIEKIASTNNYY